MMSQVGPKEDNEDSNFPFFFLPRWHPVLPLCLFDHKIHLLFQFFFQSCYPFLSFENIMSNILHVNLSSIGSLLDVPSTLSKPSKRWHLAFATIYCSRALHSLLNDPLSNNKNKSRKLLLNTPPFVALDVKPCSGFSDIDQTSLTDLVKAKNLDQLLELGGVEGVAEALKADFKNGIHGDVQDVARRKQEFGSNTYQKPPPKSILHFVEGWYDGGSIFLAVFLVISVSAVSNFKQNRQFDKLSKVSNNIQVDVVRQGRRQQISIFEIVVGDVVCLKIGDQVPADGLFLDGHSLQVNESSMTGESDHVEVNTSLNPFLFSGTKIADGYGRMLVTSVGMNTTWGEMMSTISRETNEQTPLQARLNKLTSSIGKVGLAFNGSKTKADDIVNAVVGIIAAAVTIVVVAIPEGLPLAVTLTLAYSMKRMMADQAMVRKLSACETMGSATTICTDKTGTLTLNQMKPSSFKFEFSGSPTEKAILSWAVLELDMDMERMKKNYNILHVEAFNSEKKRSGILIRKKADNTIHVHWKGAAEMILAMCSSYYDVSGSMKDMDDGERMIFEQIIQEDSLTLIALVGIKDPCRPGVRKAVEDCQYAGVNVKMITGDNIFTARAIATEFDKIHVMARSSPFDKLLMVQCLKQKGHVVAVTGDGTNDAPALKEADIGLSMGIQGTEVAKESSDIIILDDNFASVATVLRWGRCVYNNIQKFIQFQLTVNVAALVINFVAAASAGEVPLTAVQLLWVNLIMDTLGALALATERPTKELMEKPPVGRAEPLITNIMWRNLLAQALYQIVVLLTLQFNGESIFGNKLFLGIIGITIILQVVMVEFLKKFADTERLDWGQWGACIGVAAASWPIGWLVKCIPVSDKPKYFVFIHINVMCGWKSEQLYPFLLVGSYGRMVGKRYDSDASAWRAKQSGRPWIFNNSKPQEIYHIVLPLPTMERKTLNCNELFRKFIANFDSIQIKGIDQNLINNSSTSNAPPHSAGCYPFLLHFLACGVAWTIKLISCFGPNGILFCHLEKECPVFCMLSCMASLENVPTILRKPIKRWRLAFATIYFSRTLRSLLHHPLSNNNSSCSKLPSSTPPFLVLDVKADADFSNVDQTSLTALVKEKNLDQLLGFGGVEGVAVALRSDVKNGIHGAAKDVAWRQEAFGSNTYPRPPTKSFFHFVVEAFKDLTILVLLVCATLSLCFGIKEHGLKEGWYDGGSILVALSKVSNNIQSDNVEVNTSQNPFLFSGTKVADGYALMLVTSVGMNTTWGQMMSTISRDTNEQTPLQARLNELTSSIGKVGLTVAFLVLVTKSDDVVNAVVGIIASAVSILVMSIPEGLPLAVTLTLAYSMKRMMADQAMVRKLSACETMGSATTICTDKTGTLTLNQMKVTNIYRDTTAKLEFSAFNSEKKRSGILMRKKTDNTIHVHWKGAAEMILAMCSSYYDASGRMKDLNVTERMTFEQIIQGRQKIKEDSLTLIGLMGIKDPCRPGVRKAVEDCQHAGVNVKMITGDNVFTARAIATEFDKICVMARSSPFDKLLMIRCLKQKGHVVAVTGDGTNDAPALKEADIGLSMGIQGTEVAKESSDIIILDDNFASVAMVLSPIDSSATVVAQALYQIAVLLTLQFKGGSIFGVKDKIKNTLIFNTFVLCQVFNEFNARKLEKKNIFKGIHKNKLFLGVIGITVILQVVMVEFLNKFADTERLDRGQWEACIAIAAMSWPIGFVVKCIPVSEKPFLRYLKW
ncbi:unnamed protein product, partial [Vitis vinifera]